MARWKLLTDALGSERIFLPESSPNDVIKSRATSIASEYGACLVFRRDDGVWALQRLYVTRWRGNVQRIPLDSSGQQAGETYAVFRLDGLQIAGTETSTLATAQTSAATALASLPGPVLVMSKTTGGFDTCKGAYVVSGGVATAVALL